jgi:hypothetical protein
MQAEVLNCRLLDIDFLRFKTASWLFVEMYNHWTLTFFILFIHLIFFGLLVLLWFLWLLRLLRLFRLLRLL